MSSTIKKARWSGNDLEEVINLLSNEISGSATVRLPAGKEKFQLLTRQLRSAGLTPLAFERDLPQKIRIYLPDAIPEAKERSRNLLEDLVRTGAVDVETLGELRVRACLSCAL